jgi:hypothetical protein
VLSGHGYDRGVPGAVIVIPQRPSAAVAELAAIVSDELIAQGVPAPIREGAPPQAALGRVVVAIGTRDRPGDTVPARIEGLGGFAGLRRTILIDDGPPGALDEDPLLAVARRAGAVFALDEGSARAWRRAGVAARALALGYMPDRDTAQAAVPRPLALVGLGGLTPRRARWRAEAEPVLARHRSALWTADADLGAAKVAINLHATGGDPRLSWLEVLPAIHAGAVVVSEHATGLEPLVPGRHLLVADASALAWVAEGLLADRARLAQMREDAVRRIEGWRPLALSISALRIAIVQRGGRV